MATASSPQEDFAESLISLGIWTRPIDRKKERDPASDFANWVFMDGTPKHPQKKLGEREKVRVNWHSYSVSAVTVMRTLIPRFREYMVDARGELDLKSTEQYDSRQSLPNVERNVINNPNVVPQNGLRTEHDIDLNFPFCTCYLGWPPNLFAFTSFFLNGTGIYTAVTTDDDWTRNHDRLGDYRKVIKEIANKWQTSLETSATSAQKALQSDAPADWKSLFQVVPKPLRILWEYLVTEFRPEGIGDWDDIWADHRPGLFHALMILHAIADEVCVGWGIRKDLTKAPNVAGLAENCLRQKGTLATIHPHRARVLPSICLPSTPVIS